MNKFRALFIACLVAVSSCGPSDGMLEMIKNGQAAEAELSDQLACEAKIGVSKKNGRLEKATVFVAYDCIGDRTPETVRSIAEPIISKHFGTSPESISVNIQSE